jgi:hypothetical protein
MPMDGSERESTSDLGRAGDAQPDRSAADLTSEAGLIAEGGTQIVWEDRWQEEQIFANRLVLHPRAVVPGGRRGHSGALRQQAPT